jgi:hypothetical protein
MRNVKNFGETSNFSIATKEFTVILEYFETYYSGTPIGFLAWKLPLFPISLWNMHTRIFKIIQDERRNNDDRKALFISIKSVK